MKARYNNTVASVCMNRYTYPLVGCMLDKTAKAVSNARTLVIMNIYKYNKIFRNIGV